MKRADAALNGDRLMKRGDVAEPDDRPRIARDRVEVDAIEDAHCAVSAARKEESIVFVGPQEPIHLGQTLVVGAGEITAMAMIDVAGDGDAIAARFDFRGRCLNARQLRRRGSREDCDMAVGRKGARARQHCAADVNGKA
ncbi:MAG TPA: hypothetical protein VN181_04355 [Thermoanaerobaculia bacterium]|nr:hypothetical protein [Thermoanaerobaculia bacterium]